MGKINFEEMDEQMNHFWWKLGENKHLNRFNLRKGYTISGAAVEGEDSYLLEARYLESEKKIKFTQYYLPWQKKVEEQGNWLYKGWERLPINADNTIPPFGMPHYICDIEPQNVDGVVERYFAKNKKYVEDANQRNP